MSSAPHDAAAERALIGSVLVRPGAAPRLIGLLDPEDFFLPAHGAIWRAIGSLVAAGREPDPVTLEAELRAQGKGGQTGGLGYLAEVQAEVATAENAPHYAALVADAATARRLMLAAGQIGADAAAYRPGAPVAHLVETADARLAEATRRARSGGYRPAREAVRAAYDAIERRTRAGQRGITGVATGYADLDRITCGLQPADLVILAARPSVGKTSLALNIAAHAAIHDHRPVLVFSVEMSAAAVGERLACSLARIDGARVRGGWLDKNDWTRLAEAAALVERAPIWIDADPAPTARQVVARARAWRADRVVFGAGADADALGLVIVDYLQLVRPGARAETREREVAETSAACKAGAKITGCPWLVLSQLRRGADERSGSSPRLSDLRESGSLEQDADVVAFLHRPSDDDRATVRLTVAKQRSGPVGECDLAWLPQFTRFENAARPDGFVDRKSAAAGEEGW